MRPNSPIDLGRFSEDALRKENTPHSSQSNSTSDLMELANVSTKKTLAQRSEVPLSIHLVILIVFAAQLSGSIYSQGVMDSVLSSLMTSVKSTKSFISLLSELTNELVNGQYDQYRKWTFTVLALLAIIFFLYVLFIAPFLAGMWFGQKARRHLMHRYMGLAYLFMYFAAWVEFLSDDQTKKDSYLPHFISLLGEVVWPVCMPIFIFTNFAPLFVLGIIQGVTAYFSFKVLPDIADPGYYSDKAVLSRRFIHENIYFSTVGFVGSCLYNNEIRTNMMAHPIGKLIVFIFLYWPYVVIRPFFPSTSFSDAGSGMAGRSPNNERFYKIGTLMVKVFYLWGKFVLGFFFNWICYLNIGSHSEQVVIRGIFLMNIGTLSISVFLHTLRFKRVLPPTLTFSIYLGQIYGTFIALPYCINLFLDQKILFSIALLGIVVNFTRNRALHGVWCGFCMYTIETLHPKITSN
jgi:hypothetical protein